MDRVPYLDLQAQYDSIRTEVLAALGEVCESGRFAQGPATSDFEAKFAAYCSVDHCVSLNSGTSALHLALRCLNIEPGDEVIYPNPGFPIYESMIEFLGARAVPIHLREERAFRFDISDLAAEVAKLKGAGDPLQRIVSG